MVVVRMNVQNAHFQTFATHFPLRTDTMQPSHFPHTMSLSQWPGRVALSALAAAAVLTLAACGGGGGASASSDSPATAAGTATYSGAVSGLGSIVVNGVRFSTSGASTVDPDDGTSPYLRAFALGTTVSVTGDVDDNSSTATASSITVHGGVRGAVAAVDTGASTLTVAGQVIKVDANTIFEISGTNQTLAGLLALMGSGTLYVEVYVVGDATNGYLATRVEQESASSMSSDGYAVVGKIVAGSLNTSARTFRLLLSSGVTITVQYADNTVRPTGATLADGASVRVISLTDPGSLANGASLTATKVIVKRDRVLSGRAKMRGVVSSTSGNIWVVNDVTVDVSQARLEGLPSRQVSVGSFVKVQGSFSNGVLVASKVEADNREYDAGNGGGIKLYGMVSNATAASGGSPATFSIQGVTLTIEASSGVALPANGSYVEVIARLVDGVITVVNIGGSGAQRSFEVYGTASCTNGSSDLMSSGFSLTLSNGSTATVDGRTATIELESGVSMAAATSGTARCLVEVKGAVNSGVITATGIEVKSRTLSTAP